MDGVGWVWMMPSQLGKHSRLGLGFAHLAWFSIENLYIIVDIYFQGRG